MNESKHITLRHIKRALAVIISGEKKYAGVVKAIEYEQGNYCGTACCLMGHAALIAGRYTAKEFVDEQKKYGREGYGPIFSDIADENRRFCRTKGKNRRFRLALHQLMRRGTTKIKDFIDCFESFGIER